MVRVKTFTSALKVFQTKKELDSLDEVVNKFISEKGIKKVLSVSDSCTADDKGSTIGIIRVLAYEEGG